MNFLYENFYGVANLGWFGYVVVTLLWLHGTMMAVTLYYHRDQAHRSVDLHPVIRHICRFWLWLNTGSSTREWVAVHRKHHAHCEKEGDPHSPRLFGLKRVLLEGAELYRFAARDRDTLEKYAKGTPNDWLENNLYHHPTRSYSASRCSSSADLVLFGVPGIIMIALQLSNMPFMAAGIVNGLCHAKGYRNFETDDASTNLWPIGVLDRGRRAAQQPSRVPDVGAVLDAPSRGRHGLAALEGARLAEASEDSARRGAAAARGIVAGDGRARRVAGDHRPPHARAAPLHLQRHAAGVASRGREPRRERELAAASPRAGT